MKKIILLSFIGIIFTISQLSAQTEGTLNVVSWNVEWFGSTFESPADDNLQERNVKTILRSLNADIYGLVEVVDSMRLRRLTDSLGSHYAFVLSPFASGNSTGTGTSWLNAQKLAFIYNKNVFTNVTARGMMRNSGSAYTAFASGRFPFMLTADVKKNGGTRKMNFILIHGKAGATTQDYQRRKDAATELKDTLDAQYSTSINLIIGDLNDALYGTICTSCGTAISSYDPIVKDSTDADHYKSITLPLSVDGQSSMTSFPNVVDNHIISNEAVPLYLPNSARIVIDVRNLVADYSNTTTDHYPVLSQYNLAGGVVTGLPTVTTDFLEIKTTPNPFQNDLTIQFNKQLSNVVLQLFDMSGKLLKTEERKLIPAGATINWSSRQLQNGHYYLRIQTKEFRTSVKLVRIN